MVVVVVHVAIVRATIVHQAIEEATKQLVETLEPIHLGHPSHHVLIPILYPWLLSPWVSLTEEHPLDLSIFEEV